MIRHIASSAVLILIPLLAAGVVSAGPMDLDHFTDFESLSSSPSDILSTYVHGTSPNRVTFNGNSGRKPDPSLYSSGIRAYWLEPGESGSIVFETAAGEVEFFARDVSPGATASSIEALDASNSVLQTINLTSAWESYAISGVGAVASLRIVNPGGSTFTGVDDFGYSAIPEPSASILFMFGALGTLLGQRKQMACPR